MVVALRFLIVFHWLIVSAFIISVVIFGLYFLWNLWREKEKRKAWEASTEGILSRRIEHCQREIKRNQSELETLDRDIADLQAQMTAPFNIDPVAKAESERLIRAFQQEKQIRAAKLAFFHSALNKLQDLLENHRLREKIVEKRTQLKALREHHFEDIADLENFKSDLEYDRIYLETIGDLTNRIIHSEGLKDVESLKLEMEKLAEEMRRI
ncbi:MAG: hypothetical protein D6714_20995 [Bacteroidetes bacterium]|nr:MAG: hypothetical protein D6714_20995 [Bacteroidota bacterium]